MWRRHIGCGGRVLRFASRGEDTNSVVALMCARRKLRNIIGMNEIQMPGGSVGAVGTTAPRSYLFALTDGGGTVPPEIGVARRLAERGHRIRVLAQESMADQVLGAGVEVLPWASRATSELRDWARQSPMSQARGMVEHMIAGPAPTQARDTVQA